MSLHWIFAKKNFAHALLLVAQLAFSGWHIVATIVLKKGADPFIFALYREISASILMFGLVFYQGIKIKIERVDYPRFLFLGLCSFINVVGAMLALQYISATRFAIFQPSIPCFASLISITVGLEKITIGKSIGILLAVGGAVMVEAWGGSSSDSGESNVYLGTIIVTIQCFGMANLIVFSKKIVHKYPPPLVTAVFYSIGSVITLFACAGWAYRITPYMLYFDGEIFPWIGLAYAATFGTLYPYNAMSWAGKQLNPSTTTLYSTFQPVGTTLLSFFILNAVVTVPEIVGGFFVILGLIVTVKSQQLAENDGELDSIASSKGNGYGHSGSTDENGVLVPVSDGVHNITGSTTVDGYNTVHTTEYDTNTNDVSSPMIGKSFLPSFGGNKDKDRCSDDGMDHDSEALADNDNSGNATDSFVIGGGMAAARRPLLRG